MAIRSWSGRKLARTWACGLALEVVLVAGSWAIARSAERPESPDFRAFRLQQDSIDRGLRPPLRTITVAERAGLTAMMRDSLGIAVETRGDTTRVDLPPRMDRNLARAFDGLGTMIVLMLIVIGLVYLPIPLALVGVTVVWLVTRRRRAAPTVPAAPTHSTFGPPPR